MPGDERTLQPAAFLGHGNPMNALGQNRFTQAWRDFGAQVPPPRAILAISAHWYVRATAVTAMRQPRTIHDFSGFPQELFAVQYPAPGSPELAEEVRDLLAPTHEVALDDASWGIDHGTWSVLVHAFGEADVPVVQLSLDARRSFAEHLSIGAQLAPLRERGVLILGSGNIVHNLGRLDWGHPDTAFDWAVRFDEAAGDALREGTDAVMKLQEHPDFALAVPTPDHFLPMLYLAGLAEAAGVAPVQLIEGYDLGGISMTSYALEG